MRVVATTARFASDRSTAGQRGNGGPTVIASGNRDEKAFPNEGFDAQIVLIGDEARIPTTARR